MIQKGQALSLSQGLGTRRRSLEQLRAPTIASELPSHLTWLSTPPSALRGKRAVEDEAVSDFIDKYVIYPCSESSSSGFLEHLPSLFKEVNVKGRYALRWAVKATAFADRSTGGDDDDAAIKALEFYGRSLAALEKSLSTKGKAPDDYDLMTVVMLDIFEVSDPTLAPGLDSPQY